MSTASALERELRCAASAVLGPRVHGTGEEAVRGNVIHVFCRSVAAGTPRSLALAAVPTTDPKWRETCEQIDFEILCGGLMHVRAEVAYRMNLETDEVREIGVNLGRRYPPRAAHEVDGTNDLEGRRPFGGMWVVTDLKTGREEYVTRCVDNPQMKFHARALMQVHDVDQVEARVAFIGEGGEIGFDTHIFTRLELDLFGDELVASKRRVAESLALFQSGTPLDVYAGSHCRYCPAAQVCPRNTALAHAMISEVPAIHAKWGQMTDDERRIAAKRIYDFKPIFEMVESGVKALATASPIDMGQGKVLRETGSGVRIVNAPKRQRRRVA